MENTLKIEFDELFEKASEGAFNDGFLEILASRFPGEVIFSTSFSYEDQVVTHLIKNLNIDIFTLDTGRLLSKPMKPGLPPEHSSKRILRPIIRIRNHCSNLFQKTDPIPFINL